MVTAGLIVRLEAKDGKEEEVTRFLESALPLVEEEPADGRLVRCQTGPKSFVIVDCFPDERGRQAHLAGAVATALAEAAEALLAQPPEIQPVAVLAAKLPDRSDERTR